MKTFITCAGWKNGHADTVEWIVKSGVGRHGSNIEFHTGVDMRHIKIAEVLNRSGVHTVFYILMPFERNQSGMLEKLLEMNAHIMGLSGGYGQVIDQMASSADNLFTLDRGDALYRAAVSQGIPTWQPLMEDS